MTLEVAQRLKTGLFTAWNKLFSPHLSDCKLNGGIDVDIYVDEDEPGRVWFNLYLDMETNLKIGFKLDTEDKGKWMVEFLGRNEKPNHLSVSLEAESQVSALLRNGIFYPLTSKLVDSALAIRRKTRILEICR